MDLNVGLKTSYNDFYAYYTKKHPDDLLAKEIRRNIDSWSDLEFELGQFTRQISPQRKEEFWSSEENMENELAKYLEREVEKIHLEDMGTREKTESEMFRSLTGFYKKNKEDIESLKSILEDGNNIKEYSFINFNFTDTLERCLDILGERFHPVQISLYEKQKALHIHGSIRDCSIVLGVNDESQIANKNFRDSESKLRLIKSYINDDYGNTRTRDAHAIINRSDIICVFGMSLGKTDQTWWQYLVEWILKDHSRKLVIFTKEDGEYNVKKKTLQKEREIRKKFFDNGNIPDDMCASIPNEQIYVVINAELFCINLV